MSGHSTFAGLKNLMAKAGFKTSAATTPAAAEEPDAEDLAAAAGAGDDPDEGDDANTDTSTGDDAGGDEGADDDGTDTSTGEDATGEPAGNEAAAGAPRRSADFLAGQRHGAQQTAGRFAAVLVSPVARANLEMATDLLANSTMTPSAIIAHCDRYKGEHAAKSLLDRTAKVDIGGGQAEQPGDNKAGASVRKKATAATNKSLAKKAGVPVRTSRRAAAAATGEN